MTLRNASVFLIASVAGCGDSRSAGPHLPVEGTVTLGTKPLSGGTVTYFPLGVEGTQPPPSVGVVDTRGRYSLKTSGKDGTPAGKYVVIVTTSGEDKGQDNQFNSIYSNAQESPLKKDVIENAAPGHYDLQLIPVRAR